MVLKAVRTDYIGKAKEKMGACYDAELIVKFNDETKAIDAIKNYIRNDTITDYGLEQRESQGRGGIKNERKLKFSSTVIDFVNKKEEDMYYGTETKNLF